MKSAIRGRAPLAACVCLLTLACGMPASAQDLASAPVVERPYEGMRLVQVMPDEARIEAAMDAAQTVWTHRPGVGRELQLVVDEAGLARLSELGLSPVTLIENVQDVVDAHLAEVHERRAQRGAGWYDSFRTYSEIVSHVEALASSRPDLASTGVFGSSIEGRDLVRITITGPDQPGNMAEARPVVLFNGCQHAREWISPMTVTYLAEELIGQYDTNPRVRALLDGARVVIAPVVNPDGYVYTWNSQRLWRKNRRGGYGVDLNRNWGYEWGGQGSSGFTGDDIYRGSAPFSEPETTALRDLALSFGSDLVAHIDYHSFSQLILWPFGYAEGVQTPEPDRTAFDTLSTEMSGVMQDVHGAFYDPIQSVDLYPASGASTDWFYGEMGATSFTIELRDTGFFGFELPPEQIIPTAEENFEGMLHFAERTTQLLAFSLAAPLGEYVQAEQANELDVYVVEGVGTRDDSSVTLHARVGASGAFATSGATPVGGDAFRVSLPAAACGETIEFFLTAQTLAGQTLAFPSTGEAAPFSVEAAQISVVFEDDFETDQGWSVSGNISGTSSGAWERAVPTGGGDRGDPASDFDGSGQCFLTGAADGNTDVDDGTTILTSPPMDASGAPEARIHYARWFSNTAGGSPNEDVMVVEISGNNGGSWVEIETVGPTGPEAGGGWIERTVRVADYVTPGAQVRVRFSASDLGSGSVVEAGVDAVHMQEVGCPEPSGCNIADMSEPYDVLDFSDVVAFLGAFAAMDSSADLSSPLGVFDFSDVVAFLGAFGSGCP